MTDSQPSTARQLLGGFADKLVDLTDDVLFGDVWERPELSSRDHSLVTITALVTTTVAKASFGTTSGARS